MYERSAIVLERYFDNLLGYGNECNLRENYNNYGELVTKLEKYQVNYQKELSATQEYNESIRKIKSIQMAQEKLYKKSAKLEYSRNLLFSNIDEKPEETRRCIEKIEEDVEKNNNEMKALKEELIEALVEYNGKRFELSKCKRYKKMAENDYDEVFETARDNYEGISDEDINIAKKFAKFNDNEEIVSLLEENGSREKIPFNEEVMEAATNFDVEVAKKEVASYLVIYDKMTKLLGDINNGTARIELHKKYLRNEKAKLDFIYAVKDYIVQFLDYERMTIVHGRKSHNRLMSEACENFNTDAIQINNLYELLIKEVANKATKKAYKELYNKSYLKEIKEKEERFKREKNRINLNTATLLNSNYWRIEGIRNIYTIFYKNVSEVFGRDVAEFDLPKEFREYSADEADSDDNIDNNDELIIDDTIRIPFDIDDDDEASSSLQNEENNEDDEDDEDDVIVDNSVDTSFDILDNVIEEIEEGTEVNDIDIFGEKYKDIDVTETIRKEEEKLESNLSKNDNSDSIFDNSIDTSIFSKKNDEEGYVDYKSNFFTDINEEETLFSDVKKIKNKRHSNEIENIEISKEDKKQNSVLRKLRKINGAKKTSSESDIW